MRDVKDPEVRKAEIMEAALALFVEKGYLKTTTQHIIEKVKISRGLLYYHFKDKEDILYCLVERYSKPLLSQLSLIAFDNLSAIEKVRSFVKATLISPSSVTEDMVALQQTIDLEQNRYLMDRFAHKLSDIVTGYFANIIKQGISEGVFQVKYPVETASFLINGYVFVSVDVNTFSDNDKQQYISAYENLLDCALGAQGNIFNC